MRKQDRIAREQGREPQPRDANERQEPEDRGDRVKGSSSDQPKPPQRESGKLPLPD